MARLEEIRRDNLRLADPRGPRATRRRSAIVARGKTIVAAEPRHPLRPRWRARSTAMETAYCAGHRATTPEIARDPRPDRGPDDPVAQPGRHADSVTEWYRQTLGTPFEGTDAAVPLPEVHRPRQQPRLVHVHAGGEPADRARTSTTAGGRRSCTTCTRWARARRAHVRPALRRPLGAQRRSRAARGGGDAGHARGGAAHRARASRASWSTRIYDAWTPARAYPHTHGGVRILSETASARLATPIEVPLRGPRARASATTRKVASWNFPAPWPGGTWRLRDIVDYQLAATRAILDARRAQPRVLAAHVPRREPAGAPRARSPTRSCCPPGQRRPAGRGRAPARAAHGRRGGAPRARAVRGRRPQLRRRAPTSCPMAAAVQRVRQDAARAPALSRHPRQCPGGPPQRPYDVTAHTLPLLLGVDGGGGRAPFTARPRAGGGGRASRRAASRGADAGSPSATATAGCVALGRLLRAACRCAGRRDAFTDDGRRYPAGTLLAPGSARGPPGARWPGSSGLVAHGGRRAPARARPARAARRPLPVLGARRWTRAGRASSSSSRRASTTRPCTTRTSARAACATRFDAIVLPDQAPDADP